MPRRVRPAIVCRTHFMTATLPSAFLEWRDEWTLEVGFMDEDHRHLASLINRLARDFGPHLQSGQLPPSPEAPSLADALDELYRAAREHFHREEDVMRNDGYPDFDDHKADHDLLLAELSVLTRELQETDTLHLDAEVLDNLKDWLLGHVLDYDRRLADFLQHPDRPVPLPTITD